LAVSAGAFLSALLLDVHPSVLEIIDAILLLIMSDEDFIRKYGTI
jgi:hypothetical protein